MPVNSILRLPRLYRSCAACVIIAASLSNILFAADSAGEFTKPTIDIGLVASSADRTAAFLTNAIGFAEVPGFAVTSDLGRKIGLLNGQAGKVRVFSLGDGDGATRLKVLSFPETPGKAADQAFISSTLGIRFLTIYIRDVDVALARLKKANVPLLGETPVNLGNGSWLIAFKDPDGNFIELVGPRK